jgi:PTH1 family peptidyl-tRNA hydrolase
MPDNIFVVAVLTALLVVFAVFTYYKMSDGNRIKEWQPMWLFVGLGNPGKEYALNRHNVGFMAVDEIAARYGAHGFKKKFNAEMAEVTIEGRKVVLLKPQTFMNVSGKSVQPAAAFFKIKPENIVVFYDELDLEPGKLRVKKGGGSGGHNGIKSIDNVLGNKEYWRVRIGIGHPGDKNRVTGYVLGNFAKEDQIWLDKLIPEIARQAEYLTQGKMDDYMTQIARHTQ